MGDLDVRKNYSSGFMGDPDVRKNCANGLMGDQDIRKKQSDIDHGLWYRRKIQDR